MTATSTRWMVGPTANRPRKYYLGRNATASNVPQPPNPNAVQVDSSWLAANGGANGPWTMGTAGTTYQLATEINAPDSAFLISANNITFDLNGHNITFGARTQPTVLNPYFSDNVTVPGKPDHWDVSGAPSAAVVAITDHVKPQYGFRDWAPNCLKLATFSTVQIVESEAIAIPTANVEYCANIMAVTTLHNNAAGTNLRLQIIDTVTSTAISGADDAGNVGDHSDATTDDLASGASNPFYFTPTTTHAVKFRITATPPTSNTTTIYMSAAVLKTSRVKGVTLTLHSVGTTCTITDTQNSGSIVCANDNPKSPCISANDNTGNFNISNIHARSSGLNSHVFNLHYCSGVVQGCTLTDGGTLVSNRQRVICGIYADSAYQGGQTIEIKNNNLSGCKHLGVFVSQSLVGSTIHGNTISCDSRYTDAYAVSVPDNDQGIEVYGNTINQTCGRGILVDQYTLAWGTILIHDNVISVYEKGNIEFDPNGLEVTGIRIRENFLGAPNVQVYNNTITATTDASGVHAAIGLKPTCRTAGVTWSFTNNACKAIITNASEGPTPEGTYWACGFAVSRAVGGNLAITDNTFESNCLSMTIGEPDSFARVHDGLTFRNNTFKRNTTEGTQGSYLPATIGMEAGTVSNTALIGNLYTGGASAIDFTSNSVWGDWANSKVVNVGWLVTVTVQDGSAVPIAGATVVTKNASAVQDDSQVTGADGKCVVKVITDNWNQAGTNAGGRTHTTYTPHTATASAVGHADATISLGSLTADGTATITMT